MTQIKESATELKSIVSQIAKKKELLKDYKENNEKVQKLQDLIKETQEEIKVILAADLDYFEVENEMKELVKELKQGAKNACKNTGVKPADLIAFMNAQLKDEGVVKVVEKGQIFSSLRSQTN